MGSKWAGLGVGVGFDNCFGVYSSSWTTLIFYVSFNSDIWFWLIFGVIFFMGYHLMTLNSVSLKSPHCITAWISLESCLSQRRPFCNLTIHCYLNLTRSICWTFNIIAATIAIHILSESSWFVLLFSLQIIHLQVIHAATVNIQLNAILHTLTQILLS